MGRRDPLERFMEKVEKQPDGCWFWVGRLDKHGYGAFDFQRSEKRAHRVGYELLVGEIPAGLHLDHLCRRPRCVAPDHLEPVTQAENNRRAGAVKTACPHGHPLDGTRNKGNGRRYCKTCQRLRARKRYALQRLAA